MFALEEKKKKKKQPNIPFKASSSHFLLPAKAIPASLNPEARGPYHCPFSLPAPLISQRVGVGGIHYPLLPLQWRLGSGFLVSRNSGANLR